MTNFEKVKQDKIIAILRGIPSDKADLAIEALVQGGISIIEVTMNTDNALEMISRSREIYGGRLLFGAGTVLDLGMAKEAVAAGAQFIISPNLDETVIEYGLSQGVDVWPGTMTPTEIVRAWKAGAQAVKVFPMGSLGINYLKEIRAPLDHIPMIATGGVNLDNIRDFLKAGAVAVGLGGNLANKTLVQENRFDEITENARQYVQKVKA